jgi:predicted RNA binding protein YcfA (HicA-like mRNA interferase family)
MKAREFVRDHLMPAGATLVKKDGDHYVYALPNGRRMVVPMGGKHSEAKPYLVRRLQRLLEGREA